MADRLASAAAYQFVACRTDRRGMRRIKATECAILLIAQFVVPHSQRNF